MNNPAEKTVCNNCQQWQDEKTGDCFNECAKRGFAEYSKTRFCQKCEKNQGGKWKSSKSIYTWLCGRCKFNDTFSDTKRKERFEAELSVGCSVILGSPATVKILTTENSKDNKE